MKLRNKKTGEIREIREILIDGMFKVSSLAELNEEWEDYEEQKAYYIERCGTIEEFDTTKDVALTEMLKEIGNYFETEEEAEKAEKVNSNSQLYKQAGNSIVVNVLEGILKNLLENEYGR